MFHLIVKYQGWAPSRDSMFCSRVLEFTDDAIVQQFKPGGTLDLERVLAVPALFVSETAGAGDQNARVGNITRIQVSGGKFNIDYTFDDVISPIPNPTVERFSSELGIKSAELSRTHWAIKDVDLFRVLLRSQAGTLPTPKVFQINKAESVNNALVSVMMPLNPQFDAVYGAIKATAEALKMECLRADDIWEHDSIIQDIVSLINRSRIVVCDCTGRNPNVFYEVGIAHTLGRDVILVSQSEADIPFDLRHLRYVTYLNNAEGRGVLMDRLRQRMDTLSGQRSVAG